MAAGWKYSAAAAAAVCLPNTAKPRESGRFVGVVAPLRIEAVAVATAAAAASAHPAKRHNSAAAVAAVVAVGAAAGAAGETVDSERRIDYYSDSGPVWPAGVLLKGCWLFDLWLAAVAGLKTDHGPQNHSAAAAAAAGVAVCIFVAVVEANG